ncbi:retrotransposon gag domain-containing protein, partial [Salmonella enterica]|nr:retrotransposon gag domain-containing protein [Salmonella enterica]
MPENPVPTHPRRVTRENPVDSGSVHDGGDLRDRLNAKRASGTHATASTIPTDEAKELRDRLASLEKDMGQVAEVVRIDRKGQGQHDHPFTAEVMRPPLPERFKEPKIPLYNGKTDPDDHLERYVGHMVLHGYSQEIMCRAFRNHLEGNARRWFRSLKPGSVGSWEELKRAFSAQFIGVRQYIPPKQNLTMVYQGPAESLKDWLARFGQEVAGTENVTDAEALMGAVSSMRKDTPFKTDLDQKPPKSYQEFLLRAQGFINAEEAQRRAQKGKAAATTSTTPETKNAKQNNKRRRSRERGPAEPRWNPAPPHVDARRSHPADARKPRQQRYDTYHDLTMSVEDIYHRVSNSTELRHPRPIRSDPSVRDQNKYCQFHGEHGHNT